MPSAFRYPDGNPRRIAVRNLVMRCTGVDLFPTGAVAQAFIAGLSAGDPVSSSSGRSATASTTPPRHPPACARCSRSSRMGNAGTNDTYTEGWLPVPLSLSGGYAGQRALHRYLETSRWWIEVCRPGAILTPGSRGRNISMHVRIMVRDCR